MSLWICNQQLTERHAVLGSIMQNIITWNPDYASRKCMKFLTTCLLFWDDRCFWIHMTLNILLDLQFTAFDSLVKTLICSNFVWGSTFLDSAVNLFLTQETKPWKYLWDYVNENDWKLISWSLCRHTYAHVIQTELNLVEKFDLWPLVMWPQVVSCSTKGFLWILSWAWSNSKGEEQRLEENFNQNVRSRNLPSYH